MAERDQASGGPLPGGAPTGTFDPELTLRRGDPLRTSGPSPMLPAFPMTQASVSATLRIYDLAPDANRYLCLQAPDLRYFQDRFDGRPMARDWVTPTYAVLNSSKKVADFTSWQIGSKTFLVSEKAKGILQDLCGTDLEFLPFDRVKRTDLYAVNVLRTEDYLDWKRTEFMPGADIPLRAAWRPELPSVLPPVFKVVGGSSTYVSQALGRAAVECGLTGLRLGDPSKNHIEQLRRGEPFNEFPGL